MASIRNIFVVVLIFILSSDSFGAALYRQKRSQNEYILHRCIASAQLMKAHVLTNRPAQSISSDVQKENTKRADAYDAITEQENLKKIQINNTGQNNYTLTSKDTPLKTLNIQAIEKDRPLIFKKKYPLPELQRNLTNGLSEMSTNVIVIKSSL